MRKLRQSCSSTFITLSNTCSVHQENGEEASLLLLRRKLKLVFALITNYIPQLTNDKSASNIMSEKSFSPQIPLVPRPTIHFPGAELTNGSESCHIEPRYPSPHEDLNKGLRPDVRSIMALSHYGRVTIRGREETPRTLASRPPGRRRQGTSSRLLGLALSGLGAAALGRDSAHLQDRITTHLLAGDEPERWCVSAGDP